MCVCVCVCMYVCINISLCYACVIMTESSEYVYMYICGVKIRAKDSLSRFWSANYVCAILSINLFH